MSEKIVQSAKEKSLICNSLICLLQGLIGRKACIELRDETEATGVITHVDSCMNVSMSNAQLIGCKGEISLEVFYVRGQNIRYVHIPDEVRMHCLLCV